MPFTREQSVALIREVDATSTLFRHGFTILRDYRFAATDAEAVFVCLAGGAEKLLKLSTGLLAVDDGDGWPSQPQMKKVGHQIVMLNQQVCDAIEKRVSLSSASGHLRELLASVRPDPGVNIALATFEKYATSGRFHNLDALSGAADDESPYELWEALQREVLDANPDFYDLAAEGKHDEMRQRTNRIIARSLGRWCELIRRSWATGVLGEIAQRHAPALDLGGDLATG